MMARNAGTCDYCGSQEVDLVAPRELRDLFEMVADIYEEAAHGKTLLHWLRSDWGIFPGERMPDDRTVELLSNILDDPELGGRKFVPPASSEPDALERWEGFREELMHRNRFFPQAELDLDSLATALQWLVLRVSDLGECWYRARIEGDRPLEDHEMGAPLKGKAGHGRANPAGIPYLYLASSIQTAIVEVRPHPGQTVAVAPFSLPKEMTIIDLASPRKTISPFVLDSMDLVKRMRHSIGFLEQLGRELSDPVLPDAAAVDYTPSQYVCEFVKFCGFDGVRYASSMHEDGYNIALFDPRRFKGDRPSRHKIKTVSIGSSEMVQREEADTRRS